MKKDLQERERVLASYNQKEIDNPTILPAGEYKEKQKHLQQQWRDECRDYYLGVMQRGLMSESGLTLISMSTKLGLTLICTSTKSGLTLICTSSTKLLTSLTKEDSAGSSLGFMMCVYFASLTKMHVEFLELYML